MSITREPVRRADNRNCKPTLIGEGELAMVRQYARKSRYTMRSIIEASIVAYLEGKGVKAPEPVTRPEEIKRYIVEVTRDGGFTWAMIDCLDRFEKDGTVYVLGTDRVTYVRESSETRNPLRWRWPRMRPPGQAE